MCIRDRSGDGVAPCPGRAGRVARAQGAGQQHAAAAAQAQAHGQHHGGDGPQQVDGRQAAVAQFLADEKTVHDDEKAGEQLSAHGRQHISPKMPLRILRVRMHEKNRPFVVKIKASLQRGRTEAHRPPAHEIGAVGLHKRLLFKGKARRGRAHLQSMPSVGRPFRRQLCKKASSPAWARYCLLYTSPIRPAPAHSGTGCR